MFWNKKKRNENESEEDLLEYNESEDVKDELNSEEEQTSDEQNFDSEDEKDEESDLQNYFEDEDFANSEDGYFEEQELEDNVPSVAVTAKINSLNSLAEFIFLRNPVNLQFMRKGTNEVFELREYHLRVAKVWGSVSMSRECAPSEYAKIMLAIELLEKPDDFFVLPALTESDIKNGMQEFCQEKYGEKSKKYAGNIKKFAKFVESNGDKDEWKLFIKEILYKKTEDFCKENEIIFEKSEDSDEVEENE